MKTENSCEFVDLLYIVVYILDEIKFSFTEIFFYCNPHQQDVAINLKNFVYLKNVVYLKTLFT